METIVRIPKDRIAVLIGKGGSTRKMLEEACGGELEIDSQTGEVSISWEDQEIDPILKMKTPDAVSYTHLRAHETLRYLGCRVMR